MKTCVVLSALLLVSVGIVSADDSGPLDLVLLTDAAKESNAKWYVSQRHVGMGLGR